MVQMFPLDSRNLVQEDHEDAEDDKHPGHPHISNKWECWKGEENDSEKSPNHYQSDFWWCWYIIWLRPSNFDTDMSYG